MRISRHFTQAGKDPFAGIAFKRVDVELADRCLNDIEVPAHWSYAAVQLFAKHYLAREAIPVRLKKVAEEGVPEFAQRSVPDQAMLAALPAAQRTTRELSAKAVFRRLAGSWTYHGFKAGYFDTEEDARAFSDECVAVLAHQLAAPNSLQWQKNGMHWAYGIEGEAITGFVCDGAKITKAEKAYVHPQLHACVLNSVKHNSANEDALLGLIERERRVMTAGASSGCYFSGGKDGALVRSISLRDKAVHTIAAQGVPRKPGAMAVIDSDHAECESFLRFMAEEHYKAAAMMLGARTLRHHLMQILAAAQGKDGAEPKRNATLKAAILQAQWALVPQVAIERVLAYVRSGFTEIHVPVYNAEVGSSVFNSMAAHNSRLALRISDVAMKAWQGADAEMYGEWAHSAWATGEPALMFKDAVADWHSCPSVAEVKSTTPGMEFLFLDDTALPLASINLAAFAGSKGVDVAGLRHVSQVMTLVLDISVGAAHYPTRDMARLSADTRPLGLSVTGLGEALMTMGIAYDSDAGRAMAAAMVGIVTAQAYACSAAMAKDMGAFTHFAANRPVVMRMLNAHRDVACGRAVTLASGRECAAVAVASIPSIAAELRRSWDEALMWAEAYGLRNAQVSCIAPMASVTTMMDARTLGMAPSQQLVFHAPQANGKARKYVHPAVLSALKLLGYSTGQMADISVFLTGSGKLAKDGALSQAGLRARMNAGAEEIAKIEAALVDATDIRAAFDPWILGEAFCRNVLKLGDKELFDDGFSLLAHMGFSAQEIEEADIYACGSKTMCGAPHLKPEHLSVFACLRNVAMAHEREVNAESQVRMMAALQPMVSGGVSHSINLPFDAEMEQFEALAKLAFGLGLKTISLTRQACQLYSTQLPEAVMEREEKTVPQVVGSLMRVV